MIFHPIYFGCCRKWKRLPLTKPLSFSVLLKKSEAVFPKTRRVYVVFGVFCRLCSLQHAGALCSLLPEIYFRCLSARVKLNVPPDRGLKFRRKSGAQGVCVWEGGGLVISANVTPSASRDTHQSSPPFGRLW